MKRYFRIAMTVLSMVAVMFFTAAITFRLALHGGEVAVPDFSGMTVAQASQAALHNNLDLNIENRFFSTTVPAGRILSQAPAAGSRVRHHWPVRVTESLGPQQVVIPDVVGQPERAASIDVRQMSLNLGTLAYLGAPGDPGIVLAQSPPPDAGVDQPRVSLLLSASSAGASSALVVPSFLGMSYTAASHAAEALGLHVGFTPPPPPPAPTPAPSASPAPGAPATPAGVKLDANNQAIAVPVVPAAPATPYGPVTAQIPESGFRIDRGASVHLIFGPLASPSTIKTP